MVHYFVILTEIPIVFRWHSVLGSSDHVFVSIYTIAMAVFYWFNWKTNDLKLNLSWVYICCCLVWALSLPSLFISLLIPRRAGLVSGQTAAIKVNHLTTASRKLDLPHMWGPSGTRTHSSEGTSALKHFYHGDCTKKSHYYYHHYYHQFYFFTHQQLLVIVCNYI